MDSDNETPAKKRRLTTHNALRRMPVPTRCFAIDKCYFKDSNVEVQPERGIKFMVLPSKHRDKMGSGSRLGLFVGHDIPQDYMLCAYPGSDVMCDNIYILPHMLK